MSDVLGYAQALPLYIEAGWPSIIPLPEARKTPPPSGVTGRNAHTPSQEQYAQWAARNPDGNTALVIPDGIIVLDIDAPDDHKVKADGANSLHELEAKYGPLPPTWTSTAHGAQSLYRHRFYRVQPGQTWQGGATAGIDILQAHHRYSVVWPSLHPSGEFYQWYMPDGTTATRIPTPSELPYLPDSWQDWLRKPAPTSTPQASLTEFVHAWDNRSSDMCKAVTTFLNKTLHNPDAKGSRHDTMLQAVWTLVHFSNEGHKGALTAIETLHAPFIQSVSSDRAGGEHEAEHEWQSLLKGAVEKAGAAAGASDPCDQPMLSRLSETGIQLFNTSNNSTMSTPTLTLTPDQQSTLTEAETIINQHAQTLPTLTELIENPPSETEAESPRIPSTWESINLTHWLNGNPNPKPDILQRQDGPCLFYSGRVNDLHGEPESGKSMVAQIACAIQLKKHQPIIYLDFEDNAGSFLQRMQAMHVPEDTLLDPELTDYRNPTGNPLSEANKPQYEDILNRQASLIIVDGLNNMLTGAGGDQDKATDIAALYVDFLKPMAKTGAAVIYVDHVVKNKDSQGRFAAGSIQKLAQIDGASYFVTASRPLGRGLIGEVTLKLAKDRNGYLSEVSGLNGYNEKTRLRETARIRIDSTDPDRMVTIIGVPNRLEHKDTQDLERPTGVMEKVSRILERVGTKASNNEVYKYYREAREDEGKKGARKSLVLTALHILSDEGYVHIDEGPNNSITNRSLRPYREIDDELSDHYQNRLTEFNMEGK